MSATATIETLTAATFDEAIAASPVPVLVDLWAEWCGPCHILEPVLAFIATEHPWKRGRACGGSCGQEQPDPPPVRRG